MDIKDLSLKIGRKYWVLINPNLPCYIGELEYNRLELCVFKHVTIGRFGLNEYGFYPDNSGEFYSVNELDLNHSVYKDREDYLMFLLHFVKKMNYSCERGFEYYTLDDFLKNKIRESQATNPHKWI